MLSWIISKKLVDWPLISMELFISLQSWLQMMELPFSALLIMRLFVNRQLDRDIRS
ncbi:unnamed protein product [Hymenolepis diminuta]|uniref:Uncharacterized protein n=1 Tax=Hymenolepis diminuta TaxID=6216 RepID=A0A564Z126_HYMDI|nr:unnamed protein product [Hymenolepis diminuta]